MQNSAQINGSAHVAATDTVGKIHMHISTPKLSCQLCVTRARKMSEVLDMACVCRVLRFLFTEINYGGRVADDKDRRLINSLVLRFCGPEVVQEGYLFSSTSTYFMPTCETAKEVRARA